MRKTASWIVLGFLAAGLVVGAGTLGWLVFSRDAAKEMAAAGPVSIPPLGGPFTLVDHTGRTVSDRDFRGKYMLVFFGYTYCPDVCPTGLQLISDTMDVLGEAGQKVQPMFITVDPERDTVEVLADYVGSFHPRLLGLTGTAEQISVAAKAFRAAYFKVGPALQDDGNSDSAESGGDGNSDYLMNHTAYTYLMGPDGRFLTLFRHGMDPEKMASEIRKYLAGQSS